MTNDQIEPLVPVMPRRTSTEPVVTDGGRPRRFVPSEDATPLLPDD